MGLTTDPRDPRLGHGVDEEQTLQHDVYLVLSEDEIAKGFVRPVRTSYIHAKELGGCGAVTWMNLTIAETYARDPHFYGATYCARCQKHLRVGTDGEFFWVEPDGRQTTLKVGT
jgi:hypothetical protein